MQKVLIIGNGFDLDLGLKTRYSDFASSPFWKFNDAEKRYRRDLAHELFVAKNESKWLDIEQVIEEYAKAPESKSIGSDQEQIDFRDEDKQTFETLIKTLTEYLRLEQEKDVDAKSLAAKVLNECINNGCFDTIYSFNYTDLRLIAKKLNITRPFKCKYVHGTLEGNRIILGVREDVELKSGYDYLRKTFSRYYSSSQLTFDLDKSNEIVFFGHSLSKNDYHYFDKFFNSQCNENLEEKQSKHITFFTYDYSSEVEIKRQLWEMNRHRTDRLYTNNDVHFILTKEPDQSELTDFFNRLIKERRLNTHKVSFR